MMAERVGIIGARGHTGAELLALIAAHPSMDLAFVGSRALAGQQVPGFDIAYQAIDPTSAASLSADAVVLALPNGLSEGYVEVLGDSVIVDLSADHRFVDDWAYGMPERFRDSIKGARRIANPGCYATAAQLALDPIRDSLSEAPRVFGVSGYSGAGTTPSPRNDPEQLRDNLMPYGLTDHEHEREIGRHLGRPVHFMPHVASFFRGITLTIDCVLREPSDASALQARVEERYRDEPLVSVQAEVPLVRDAVGQHHVTIGGFRCDGPRAVMVATIDNLLKGAATQAIQNLNLALGMDELAGITS
jgi:N-acetyl-gamma-glutamyl-phosphate reductase